MSIDICNDNLTGNLTFVDIVHKTARIYDCGHIFLAEFQTRNALGAGLNGKTALRLKAAYEYHTGGNVFVHLTEQKIIDFPFIIAGEILFNQSGQFRKFFKNNVLDQITHEAASFCFKVFLL